MDCLTKFVTPQLQTLHRGKVRDSIRIDDDRRMIVVTDRLSAFNKVLETPIPLKGAVLNGIANFWFEQTRHILDNHLIEQIDPYATIVKEATPIRVEMVVRGYLTGSMWRGYEKGEREFSGVEVPDGMTRHQAFETPLLTPTTKDKDDTAIDEKGIIERGLVSEAIYQQMKTKALELFAFGSQFLAERGIILVDTKYEFGLLDGQLILIDEIHTPDSSRFWNAEDYAKDPATVAQIDKEFVRQWMLHNKVDGEVPSVLSDAVIEETMRRYQDIYQTVVGKPLAIANIPHTVRLYHTLVQHGLIKAGVVSIILEVMDDVDYANTIEGMLEPYGVAIERRLLISHYNSERMVELAACYNTSIEPVAVIVIPQLNSNLAAVVAANLSVPVICCPLYEEGEMLNPLPVEAPAVLTQEIEQTAFAALRSLNIPAVRVQLDRDIQDLKEELRTIDEQLRKGKEINEDSDLFEKVQKFFEKQLYDLRDSFENPF